MKIGRIVPPVSSSDSLRFNCCSRLTAQACYAAHQARHDFSFSAIWRVLEQHHQARALVNGRVLHAVKGGWAVGVGGLVAFCPHQRMSLVTRSRIGILQQFFITRLALDRRNVQLHDLTHYRNAERAERTKRKQDKRSRHSEVSG